ncbi:MAG: ATP-dependent helicase [Planctomycetota bacterium]
MELNAQQRAAVEHAGGHALVLAGAGTGKTSTVVARVAHLLETGIDSKRILLLTFTRRAASEMQHRLHHLAGAGSKRITAGTFHHFCLWALRRWPKLFEHADHAVIDRDDQQQLMKMARAELGRAAVGMPKSNELVSLHSFARNTNQSARDYLEKYEQHDPDVIELILKAFKGYAERKKTCRYLDYDDILFVVARQLHRDAKTRETIGSLFQHVLVDEMQDTNPLQWLILDGIRDEANLYCVGDDAQSIYAFRGADFRNVHSFSERVPGATTLKLEQNYRSTTEILDLANWLLSRSTLEYDKQLTSARGPGIKPRLVDFDSEFEEADWVADDLLERRHDGADWKDHMILSRTAYGARSLEAALVEREIPYRFVGGMSLLQSAHVKDLLALLRCLDNTQDQIAWVRYLTLWPRIGDVTATRAVDRLRQSFSSKGAMEGLGNAMPGRPEVLDPLGRVAKKWGEPSEAVRAAAKALTPLLEKKYDRWDSRKRDFDLLSRVAGKHNTVRDFIETYTLDPVSESEAEKAGDTDVVTLITVHSAKGTEAPVCYVIQLQPYMYPHVRSLGNIDDEEEERRILYVACTRAQDELILTRSIKYQGFSIPHGGRSNATQSEGEQYFLESLPDELVDLGIEGFHSDFDDDVIESFSDSQR